MQLLSPLTIAGAERVVLMLAKNIDKSTFDISLCIFVNAKKPNNPFIEEVKKLNISCEIIYLDKTFEWKQVMSLVSILKKNKIDILHTNSHRADVTGYLANNFWNAKLISTIHGWTPTTRKLKLYEFIDRWVLRRFDCIIAVSNDIKRTLLSHNLDASKVKIVHNALDFSAYSRNADGNSFRNELGVGKDESLIGTVGRLSKEKGLKYFLSAAKKILDAGQNVKYAIVGDGPEKENLLRLADEMGLTNFVHFCGYREDISSVYSALDIFLLPSLSEGVPISLLEAAYFGKPCVATMVGGIPEIFNGIGLLTQPRDVSELAGKTLYLLNNEKRSVEYGKRMQKCVFENCNVRKWIEKVQNIYLNLMR